MTNKLNLYNHLLAGFAIKQKELAAHPSSGGSWRGGNSGCLTEDGIFLGYSPKATVLRHLGIEKPTILDDDLIFEAGLMNETHWTELLEFAGVDFKCESDIPVKWGLPNGQTITGRPDIVIGDYPKMASFVPSYGIELKLISSNGKMQRHSHFGAANPVPVHVCQAAHYSSVLGVDWVLAYTSRAHYTAFYWSPSKFQFDHRSMIIDDKTGKVISVGPFISMYDITWDGDTLLLDGKPTLITASGVERFYQYCSDCVRDKIIPERGGVVDIWGAREKRNNNVLYDDYAEADMTRGFDEWVNECRDIAEGGL